MKCSQCGCRESEADDALHLVVESGTHFRQGRSRNLCPGCYTTDFELNPDRRHGRVGMAVVGGFIFVAMASKLLLGY